MSYPDNYLPQATSGAPAIRDQQGRFVSGHAWIPPAQPVIKRLRAEAQRIVVAYFARNQDAVLERIAKDNPALLLQLAMQAANEADCRAVPDLDPGAHSPVDLETLNAEAAARRNEQAAREARRVAHSEALEEADREDWRYDREADMAFDAENPE